MSPALADGFFRTSATWEAHKAVYCHGYCMYILSHCLFNFCVKYIMQNAGLDESPAGIKIAGGLNINNLRYTDDTTLMAESEEELKSLLMRVKEESKKADLKLYIQKTKIMASSPTTSWHERGKSGSSDRFYFLGLQNHCGW